MDIKTVARLWCPPNTHCTSPPAFTCIPSSCNIPVRCPASLTSFCPPSLPQFSSCFHPHCRLLRGIAPGAPCLPRVPYVSASPMKSGCMSHVPWRGQMPQIHNCWSQSKMKLTVVLFCFTTKTSSTASLHEFCCHHIRFPMLSKRHKFLILILICWQKSKQF